MKRSDKLFLLLDGFSLTQKGITLFSIFNILFILMLIPLPSFSQLLTVDTTFNPDDKGKGLGRGATYEIYNLAIQDNDYTILLTDNYNSKTVNGIVRIDKEGKIDPTFNGGQAFGSNSNSNYGSVVKVLKSGKILVGGFFTTYQNKAAHGLVLINSDGTMDSTFKADGFSSGDLVYVNDLVEQPDGKIIVAGQFAKYQGEIRNNLFRMNADGTLDETFNTGTGFNGYTDKLALQPDGKILVGGFFMEYNGVTRYLIARLNADGSLDETFDAGEGPDGFISAITIQKDGKILVGGDFNSINGINMGGIVRLETNGTVDAAFTVGQGSKDNVKDILYTDDDKIYVVGNLPNSNGNLIKLDTQGNPDATFNTGDLKDIGGVDVFSNGQLLISGITSYNDFQLGRIARLNTDGSIDKSFNKSMGFNNEVTELDIFEDGSILVAGEFKAFNGYVVPGIAKLKTDGTFDSSFNCGSGFNGVINDLTSYPGNRMLVCGAFSSYNNQPVPGLVRLMPDGSLDESFSASSIAETNEVLVLEDGKILVAGNGVIRLNADGSEDPDFFHYENFVASEIALDKDGKIAVVGEYIRYIGETQRNMVARLNADGTLDLSFDPHFGFGAICPDLICPNVNIWFYDVAFQSDGKMLVSGNVGTYDNHPIQYIVRINTDGSFDDSFLASNKYASVLGIHILPDDNILILGGNPKRMVMLSGRNGNEYNRFDIGKGFDSWVTTMAVQADGKLIVGGSFSEMDGIGKNGLMRLNKYDLDLTILDVETKCSGDYVKAILQESGTFAADNLFTVQMSDENGSFDTPYHIGKFTQNELGSQYLKLPSGIPSGLYKFRLLSTSPVWKYDAYPIQVTGVDTAVILTGNTVAALQNNAAYEWLDCGNNYSPLPDITSQSYNIPEQGSYAVKITYQGCTDTSRCVESGIVSAINPEQGIAAIEIYPNPVTDIVSINGNILNKVLSIIDETGREVYRASVFESDHYEIDFQNYKPGLFLLRLIGDREDEIYKIVKR